MSLSWDQVQTEFAGDETTNFGPRKETGTALYQVDTLATISTQNQKESEVRCLVSAAHADLVCVAVDQHLSVFKASQHLVTIAFKHLVEDCVWSPDGSLLLVVAAGGKLFMFDATTLQSIFSYNLLPDGCSDGTAFRRIAFKSNVECCDLILLSAMGLLFVVRGFSPAAFIHGTNNISLLQEQLQFRIIQTREVHTDTTSDAIPLGNGKIITVGGSESLIAVWGWQNDAISIEDIVDNMFDRECNIVRAKLTSNNRILCALSDMNQISIWLVPELVMLTCTTVLGIGTESSLTDFLLLETEGPQTNCLRGMRLVLQEQGFPCGTVRIMDMETGKDVYTLQLGSPIALARCSSSQESLYLSEGTPLIGDSSKVSSVRLRCLTETNPETRLQRILHKKHFEEALQFARLFELDTEIVYTAQMNQVLEQLSPWNVLCCDDNSIETMLKQLWTSVDNIKDSYLVAENCMRAALPSFSDTWKLLQLCFSKLSLQTSDESDKHQALQTKILAQQNRLMTYKLIFGAEKYSANSWIRFQQANLLQMVCRKMIEHQPQIAVLLWKRHSEEWCHQVSAEVIQQMVQAVPQRLMGASIIGWFQNDLLPYIARILPRAMGSVVQWLVQRAANMELTEKDGWPQNAISFLEGINQCVTEITEVNFTSTNDTAFETATKTQVEVYSVLKPLRTVLTTLHQLQDLLKYNLRLSVGQFQQETRETLAFRMLDQVVMVELIKPTLERYITPYIIAHHLDQDSIFATYIKDLLERLGHVRSYTGQSAWEDKVLTIVSFIQKPKEKCCAVLNIINHAPLPWSAEIEQLVEEGLKIQHPLVRELQEQKKVAGVRQLMQDYGLKSSIVPSQNQIEKLAVLFVEQDKPSSLNDALHILKEYNINTTSAIIEVYFRHAIVLIRTDRILDYLHVLRNIDSALARTLGERIVSLAEICLEGHSPQPAVKKVMDQHKRHLTLAAVLTLQNLLLRITTDPVEQDELKSQLMVFTKLCALQREYNLILTVAEYSEEVHRGRIFATFAEKCLKQKTSFQGVGELTALYRLAELLMLRHENVLGELAVVEGRAGNLNAVLFFCRELSQAEPSAELGQVLHHVVSVLMQLQGQQGDDDDDSVNVSTSQTQWRYLPVVLEKLANQAVVICDAEILASCLELSKSARLWRQVSDHCEAMDMTSSVKLEISVTEPVCQNPFKTYTLDVVYTDEALVMNSSIVLPLAASSLAATAAMMKGGDEDRDEEEESALPVQNVINSLSPVISYLKENSQLQLALRFLINTYAAARQSLCQYDMGFPVSMEVQAWLDAQQSVFQGTEKGALQIFHSLLSSLLFKVLNSHRLDHKMALTYLLSAPRKISVDCLMKSVTACNFNFRKLGSIASVGVALGHMLQENKLMTTCQDLEISATWGVRLAKFKISFKEAFLGGSLVKREVITAMARCQQADIRMVAEFVKELTIMYRDFKLELEDGLMVFLEQLLRNSQGTVQFSRVRAAVAATELIDRTNYLLENIKRIYKRTSPYNYEVIEFLLGEINRLDPSPLYEKGLKLVSYLKVYTRRNPPSEFETTNVKDNQKHRDCGDAGDILPQDSSHHLPFHLLLEGDSWKIITAELDIETVPMWLKIAQLLELSTDEVYLIAVQNVVRRHVAQTVSTLTVMSTAREKNKPASVYNWSVSDASLHVLEEVQHLLSCVQNCEMALACANWVVRELPMGGDKVLGLQGCVAFAQRWYQACEDNPSKKEKALAAKNKFQKVLRKVLTEQALYVSKLAEPQLLALVTAPLDLVLRLTEHAAVVAESWEDGPVPDIYSTVQKVCEVNDLNMEQVLVTCVQKWLFPPDSSPDADTTINLSFSNLKMSEEALECDQKSNIKRVLYFFLRGKSQQILMFLISAVQTKEGENASHLGHMHCLFCLLQIAEKTDLQRFGLSSQSIREMLQVSCYLSQLEGLHIHHSLQTLNDCNKMGLVKSIWKNHRHKKSALKLIASLCLDFKLHDRKQWALLLQQMVTLHMTEELEHVLQRLCSIPALWSLPVLPSAWQSVLLPPLKRVSLPLTEEQTRCCLHCFNLLQSCPVLGQLNLSIIRQHFQHLQLTVCAVACLMMDPVVSPSDVQEVLSQASAELIDQSYSLTRLGLTLPAAVQVRELVFHSILQQGDFHLIPQQALQDFGHFIILQDNIDGFLLFAVSNDMLAEAESLIELFFQRYPERYNQVRAWCDSQALEMDSTLQVYLQMKELV